MALGGLSPGSQFTVLDVIGAASLAGTLDISLANSFVPSYGETFEIVDAGSLTGTFSSVNDPLNGITFSVAYTSSGVTLTAVPEPTSFGLLTLFFAALLTRRRTHQLLMTRR